MTSLASLIILNRHCELNGISMRQLCILTLLEHGPKNPSMLAAALAITPAAITGQTATLTSKGYISAPTPIAAAERARSMTSAKPDGRLRELRITAAGKNVLRAAHQALLKQAERVS